MLKIGFIIFCIVAWLDSVAAAQAVDQLMTLSQMLAALAFVLGIIFSLAWILRRVQQPGVGAKAKYLQVVDTINLGLKEKLVVVRVGEQKILLGVTPSTVTKIQELADSGVQETDTGLQDFSKKLHEIVSRGSQK